MKKKKLIRNLALANSEISNLKNKLNATITLKSNGQDIYVSTIEQLLLVCTYAGAGTAEYWLPASCGKMSITFKLARSISR